MQDYNQDNYKFSNLSVTNSDHKLTYRVCLFTVSYEHSSWKYTLVSMLGYFLQPVVLPIMILFSKILKRKIEWFPIQENIK